MVGVGNRALAVHAVNPPAGVRFEVRRMAKGLRERGPLATAA